MKSATTAAPLPNSIVQVRLNGGFGGAYRIVSQRTRSDGSYSISLPAATSISRIIAANDTYSNNLGSQETSGPSSSGIVAGDYAWAASLIMAGPTTVNLSY